MFYTHTHTLFPLLFLVPIVHAFGLRGGQGLGIRICAPAPLRISGGNQDAGKENAQVFWLLYHCSSGVCVFSSASVFVMHTRTCYTLQLWFHGRPCLLVRASWEIRETQGTFNVGVYFLNFFVQFNSRKVEERETKQMQRKRVTVQKL